MKRYGAAFLAVWMSLSVSAGSAGAAEYRWLNSWDSNLPPISLFAEPYQKAIEEATDGRITFNVSGPETIPTFEQFQPLASGAFQFLYTHGAFHFGTTPLLAAAEALKGTPEERRNSGVFEAIDERYQKLGAKIIALAMTPNGAYQIILKKPVTEAGNLQGYKIRGNPTYLPVIRMLGASMTTLPASEVFTSLDKGIVDGFAWLSYGVTETRLYEAAQYLLRPRFGYNVQAVLMNLNAWNGLSEEDQKILLEEGTKAGARWLEESARLMEEDEKSLLDKGLEIVEMGSDEQAKLADVWSEGLWNLASESDEQRVEAIRAIAREKGLD